MSTATNSEQLDTSENKRIKKTRDLMKQINSLVKEWETVTSKLRHISSQLKEEMEEFVKNVHSIKLPDKKKRHISKSKKSPRPSKTTSSHGVDDLNAALNVLASFGDYDNNSTSKSNQDIPSDLSNLVPNEETTNVDSSKSQKRKKLARTTIRKKGKTRKGLDQFNVSDLDVGMPDIASLNSPKGNTEGLSYDDFMAALSAPTSSSTKQPVKLPTPREGDLLKSIGVREDMNRKGMKKIKKRSITTGKKKGIYQMEVCSEFFFFFFILHFSF